MEYVYRHQSLTKHYCTDAFAVRCFDDRFRDVFFAFMSEQCPNAFDFESVAGGAKALASPEQESDRDFMLRELEKSVALHKTRRVLLFTHYDCGAYGGLARFDGNEEKQFEFHQLELHKAKKEIRKRFPDVVIELYFIDVQGVVKII